MGVCACRLCYADERVLEVLLTYMQTLHSRQLDLILNLERRYRSLLTHLILMALLGGRKLPLQPLRGILRIFVGLLPRSRSLPQRHYDGEDRSTGCECV